MIGRGDEGHHRARLSYYRTPEGSGWGRMSGDVGSPDPESGSSAGRSTPATGWSAACLPRHPSPGLPRSVPGGRRSRGRRRGDRLRAVSRARGQPPGGGRRRLARPGDRRRPRRHGARGHGRCPVRRASTVDHPAAIRAAPDDPTYVPLAGPDPDVPSRCYTDGGGRLSCLTCHDPHREAEKSASFYEAKCLSCHSSGRTGPGPSPARDGGVSGVSGGRPCPVNATKGCLDCHMPKHPVADLHTTLTDHYIRVRRPADPGARAANSE